MPKQFRLKITLWAIFFFLSAHPQKVFLCQQDLCSLKVFTPAYSLLKIELFDTISKVTGLVRDTQNSKTVLSFVDLPSVQRKTRIKEPGIHRLD